MRCIVSDDQLTSCSRLAVQVQVLMQVLLVNKCVGTQRMYNEHTILHRNRRVLVDVLYIHHMQKNVMYECMTHRVWYVRMQIMRLHLGVIQCRLRKESVFQKNNP